MKVRFHYTYVIIAFGFIITGYFSNLLIFTSIIIIHELGHYLIAKMNHLEPISITIYPFGGITKIDSLINTEINKELMVAVGGITFQIIYYFIIVILYTNHLIRDYLFTLYKMYHYHILVFNLLPIYPLDGAKILNIIMTRYLPYKLTHKISIIISIITLTILLLLNYYKFNYTTILIITIIIINLIKYHHNITYLFNKFLLERYLYKFDIYKPQKITKIDNMYKEKYHIIKEKNNYLTEKELLKRRFKGKI